ncbi:LuxR C-terminal-related transcriptional regulator [Streptomyces massasporeus]|uniref:helix-turn-helix transcriptional regulator n=1 Tax=Streptomyces massasporeus TaxID=67324 RepID=UPI0033AFE5E7
MLESLGLEPDAENTYRLLLEHPGWDVDRLASAMGCSELEVHRALDALAELQLLAPSDSSEGVTPVSPDVGLTALLSQDKQQLDARRRLHHEAETAVLRLQRRFGRHQDYAPDAGSQLIGEDALHTRWGELATVMRTECLSFFPDGPRLGGTPGGGTALEAAALKRGVVTRTVYQECVHNDAAASRHIATLVAAGGEARTVPSLPLPLVIVDRESALVPIAPEDLEQGALELRSPGIIASLRSLFESVWKDGLPWDEEDQGDAQGLSRRERELLHLLATGWTDQAISRSLGLGLRTVRRDVSGLMARLGARSRFEAGALAARAGWL